MVVCRDVQSTHPQLPIPAKNRAAMNMPQCCEAQRRVPPRIDQKEQKITPALRPHLSIMPLTMMMPKNAP
jgi:membrane glycosyltransferase